MKRLTTLVLLFISLASFSQTIEKILNGFSLGQYREVTKNELGNAIQSDKFEDGFEYEIFLVEPDTSVYMIFEYANYDLNLIWSVQLTGSKKGFDCGFKDLKLGMTTDEVINKIGKATSKEDAGEYGEKWVYENTNYSLEISPENVLQGIKLIDMSYDFYPEVDLNKLPKISDIIKTFNTKNNTSIVKLLAPGMEIYKNDSAYYFKHPIKEELKSDYSGIFGIVSEMTDFINQINIQDTLQYEENMRITEYLGTFHVAKFSKDNNYSEIVFRYLFGEYLIWVIKIN